MNDDFWGDPGSCPICGEKWQWVRPGKSQPVCECQDYCSIHKDVKQTYHSEGDYPDRNCFGWYCEECWRLRNE